MLSEDKIRELTVQLKPFFNAIEPIQIVYLFGSALQEYSFHDLDVAVLCHEKFTKSKEAFFKVLRWGAELESYLKPRIPVDLRLLNEAPVHFQHEVIRSGVIIFERNRDLRVIFEASVLTEYLDYEPTRRFFNEHLFDL
ncbi:MAG: nucleotidyltransferase domain-containing protein [bacterium]